MWSPNPGARGGMKRCTEENLNLPLSQPLSRSTPKLGYSPGRWPSAWQGGASNRREARSRIWSLLRKHPLGVGLIWWGLESRIRFVLSHSGAEISNSTFLCSSLQYSVFITAWKWRDTDAPPRSRHHHMNNIFPLKLFWSISERWKSDRRRWIRTINQVVLLDVFP